MQAPKSAVAVVGRPGARQCAVGERTIVAHGGTLSGRSESAPKGGSLLLFRAGRHPGEIVQMAETHPQTKRIIVKRVGDRVGRYLALGDGFQLQKKAIETENSDFLCLGLRLALAL